MGTRKNGNEEAARRLTMPMVSIVSIVSTVLTVSIVLTVPIVSIGPILSHSTRALPFALHRDFNPQEAPAVLSK